MKKKLNRKRISKSKFKHRFKFDKKLNLHFSKKLLTKIIFLFLLISVYLNPKSFTYFYSSNKNNNRKILKEIISFEEKAMVNLSMETFDEFYSLNSQNKLIEENIKFEKSINPDVTIIMTSYNFDQNIHRALRSVQNQSLKNIEIIIIDDCSIDNSADVIRKYEKEDPRIIFIEHDTNESPMKSRSEGIRKAKGKYLTIMDGDDALIHKDILKNSFFIAQKGNIDVIEFNHAMYDNRKFYEAAQFFYELNLTNIIYQPELSNIFMHENNNFPHDYKNRAIWGKLVKKEVFQKMLEYIGDELSDEFITWGEDTLMVVALLRIANSYYFIKEYGYYRNIGNERRNSTKANNKVCKPNDKIKDFSYFKFLKFLVSKAGNNDKYQKMAYMEVTTGIKYENYLNDFKMGQKHYELLFYIFDKVLEFDFLDEHQKENIRRLRNRAIEKRNRDKINL